MKRFTGALLAFLLVAGVGFSVDSYNVNNFAANTFAPGNPWRNTGLYNDATFNVVKGWTGEGYANDVLVAQNSYDSFRMSYRQRMEMARIGAFDGGFASGSFKSRDAYGMAPSSRQAIDCVYTSGFTVWADFAGEWAKQDSQYNETGYKYDVYGPVVGIDWSNGAFTLGLSTTYNWGDMDANDLPHQTDTNTFGLAAYAQYNTRLFYVNADLGYAYNKYDSNRYILDPTTGAVNLAQGDYHSNSWNVGGEFGFKFNLGGFGITPNIGLRYYHDRRDSFSETWWGNGTPALAVGKKGYHTLEMPVGLDLGYEFRTGGMIIVPKLRFAWIPELDHTRGTSSMAIINNNWNTAMNAPGSFYEVEAPSRNKHAFQIGGGVQAKFSNNVSAHLDYNVILRKNYYEHHLNAGVGFTF